MNTVKFSNYKTITSRNYAKSLKQNTKDITSKKFSKIKSKNRCIDHKLINNINSKINKLINDHKEIYYRISVDTNSQLKNTHKLIL